VSEATAKTQDTARGPRADLPKLAYTAREVSTLIGIPYRSTCALINSGAIGHKRAGRHLIVPAKELERYLADVQYGEGDKAS
jgi:excisionase family DNA binding protein